jgi:transcriptional regulator with XRE-family HTH domain
MAKQPVVTFGVRLRELREAAGLTQARLAERAGLHPQGVVKLERGEREPAWSTVQLLAAALGVSCAAFASPVTLPDVEPARRGRVWRGQVKAAFSERLGGKKEWLTKEAIHDQLAEQLDGLTLEDVDDCLRHWQFSAQHPYRLEKAGEGDTARYRLVKVKGKIISRKQMARWSSELIPMMDLLIREAQKERVFISQPTLCDLASKVKRVMESVTAEVPAKGSAAAPDARGRPRKGG